MKELEAKTILQLEDIANTSQKFDLKCAAIKELIKRYEAIYKHRLDYSCLQKAYEWSGFLKTLAPAPSLPAAVDADRSKYRERHYALNPSRSAPSSLAVSKPDVKTSTPPINTGIAAAVTPITAANKERAIMIRTLAKADRLTHFYEEMAATEPQRKEEQPIKFAVETKIMTISEKQKISELETKFKTTADYTELCTVSVTLTAIYYFRFEATQQLSYLTSAKNFAQVAHHHYKSGMIFTLDEYYSLARIFSPDILNKPQVANDYYSKAIMSGYDCLGINYRSGSSSLRAVLSKTIVQVLCNFFTRIAPVGPYDLLLLEVLNQLASQDGTVELTHVDNRATHTGDNIDLRKIFPLTDGIPKSFFSFVDKPSSKTESYKKYDNPGFIFFELLLAKISNVRFINILDRLSKVGCTEANAHLALCKSEQKYVTSAANIFVSKARTDWASKTSTITSQSSTSRTSFGVRSDEPVVDVAETQRKDHAKVSVDFLSVARSRPISSTPFIAPSQVPVMFRPTRPAPMPSVIAVTSAPDIKPVIVEPKYNIEEGNQNAQVLLAVQTQMSSVIFSQSALGTLTEQQKRIFDAAMTDALHRSQTKAQAEMSALETMRIMMGRTIEEMSVLKERMNENEKHMFNVMIRVGELGQSFDVLSQKIAKMDELNTIREALKATGHRSVLVYLNRFIGLIEDERTVLTMIDNGRFVFDYGRNGLVLDVLVGIANFIPVPGIGVAATAVKGLVNHFQNKKVKSESSKFIKATGSIEECRKLATSIAIAILKYNGSVIDDESEESAEKLAISSKNAAVKAIFKFSVNRDKIFVEDIALAILSGIGMNDSEEYTSAKCILKAIDDNGRLKKSRYPGRTEAEPDWLNDVLRVHANASLTLGDSTARASCNALRKY